MRPVTMSQIVNIAIYASGGGSNAEAIIEHFKNVTKGKIALIVTNNPNAGIIQKSKHFGIPVYVHSKEEESGDALLKLMENHEIGFIVLAGYLRKVNPELVDTYEGRIVNIHPALLPKFGGKGMYGMNVHKAVVEAGEKISGPTIHYVNNHYDEGAIIEQHEIVLDANDNAEEVQKKVLQLEHKYYPSAVERLINEL